MFDWAEFGAALMSVRDDNAVSITIRRGGTTLAAQSVRIARAGGRGSVPTGGGIEQANQGVVILGATTLDIQAEDRFTVSGTLYEVTVVRPNRRAATVAEGKVVQ